MEAWLMATPKKISILPNLVSIALWTSVGSRMVYAVPRGIVYRANFAPLDDARYIGNVHTITGQPKGDDNSVEILGPPSSLESVALFETLEALQSERPRRAVG